MSKSATPSAPYLAQSSGSTTDQTAQIAAGPGFSSSQEEAMLTLFRTADALGHEMQQRLKPYGITTPQYNVLRILRSAQASSSTNESTKPQGLMCSAIGRLMITPEPDITRLLARLKAHKLVTQKRDSRDGRVVLTYLSSVGAQLLAKLDPLIEQAPAELMRGLSHSELKELTRLLKKARGSCNGKEDAVQQTAVIGRPSSPHSPQFALRRHPPG